MAIGKNTHAVDRITPKQTGGMRIVFSQPAGDETAIALTAKGDNDYITKKEFVDNSEPALAQIITPIVGGTTGNPITVDYVGMINPTLIFRNADGSNYGGAVNNVDNGTGIVLTGDFDPTGTFFANSFSFIIKP